MKKILKINKRIANMIVLGYPIFCLLYLIWLGILYTNVFGGAPGDIYWDGFYLFTILIKLLTFIGFFLFLISLFNSSLHPAWIASSIIAVPMALTIFWLWLLFPTNIQVDKAQFNNRTYFILYSRNFLNYYNWILFECPPLQISCERISLYYDKYGRYDKSSNARFIVDSIGQELHVVINHDVFYTIGSPTREYVRFLSETKLRDYTYHLSRYESEGSVFYNLYKCNFHFTCVKMPFLYKISKEKDQDRQYHIQGDFFTNEIEVWTFDRWSGLPWETVFSYDNAPHCYVEACSIPDK